MRIFDGQRMQLRKQGEVLLGSVGAGPNPDISWQDHWEEEEAKRGVKRRKGWLEDLNRQNTMPALGSERRGEVKGQILMTTRQEVQLGSNCSTEKERGRESRWSHLARPSVSTDRRCPAQCTLL